eukprot:TRINITY_DN7984_c0_g1_i1.p1 TRINITY_DN7984_c0_g1~~TRINITY_DN7984_c0_g1_i1.p1  ORF type:complete len:356 (+),score=99.95 TRINITY_DN7984_c0_g1_i1:137-1069(+)
MGRELARCLARSGCHLALADVNAEKLAATAEQCSRDCGGKQTVSTHIVDVASPQAVRDFAAEVAARHGRAHLLFNNAGVASTGPFDAMTEADFDWCLRINLNGVINCCRAFLPLLKKQDKAFILNTSSVAGYFPLLGAAAYATSKYGVRGFTETLLAEARLLYPHVNVAVIHPGFVRTDIVDSARGQVDKRLLEQNSPVVPRQDIPPGATEEQLVRIQKDGTNAFYERFGYTAAEAAEMIMDGVRAGSTRIRIGWDAVYFDWWVRLFPRIWETQAGAGLVFVTSAVLRKFYGPLFGAGAAATVWRLTSRL